MINVVLHFTVVSGIWIEMWSNSIIIDWNLFSIDLLDIEWIVSIFVTMKLVSTNLIIRWPLNSFYNSMYTYSIWKRVATERACHYHTIYIYLQNMIHWLDMVCLLVKHCIVVYVSRNTSWLIARKNIHAVLIHISVIVLSMALKLFSIVLSHVRTQILSMHWHVHVVVSIMLVNQVQRLIHVSNVTIELLSYTFYPLNLFTLDHRIHGNRIIQEFLLGPKLTNIIRPEVKSYEYTRNTHIHM